MPSAAEIQKDLDNLLKEGRRLFEDVTHESTESLHKFMEDLKRRRDANDNTELPLPDDIVLERFLHQNADFHHWFAHSIVLMEFGLRDINEGKRAGPEDYESLAGLGVRTGKLYAETARKLLAEMKAHPERIHTGESEQAQRMMRALEQIPANAEAIDNAAQALNRARRINQSPPDRSPS